MAEPLRHRQTKEAATDMFSLQPPRHISTLHIASFRGDAAIRSLSERSGHSAKTLFQNRIYEYAPQIPSSR